MTSTQVETETCHHCNGTGLEPPKRQRESSDVPERTPEQLEVLERLEEAGARLAAVRRKRSHEALDAQEKAYEDITVHAAEGKRLGLTQQVMADAVGVGRVMLWQITGGKRGGS